jgi:hypothetical protein
MIDRLFSLGIQPLRSDCDDWSRVKLRSSGVIVAQAGRFDELLLFWLPRHTTVWRVWFDQRCRRLPQDQCRIYYRQPFAAPTYLTLDYFVSGLKTSVQTVDAALRTLDRVAELKRSDAIVAQLKNSRLSSRLLKRYGWERHLGGETSQHIIRRFYGIYPSAVADLRGLCDDRNSGAVAKDGELVSH